MAKKIIVALITVALLGSGLLFIAKGEDNPPAEVSGAVSTQGPPEVDIAANTPESSESEILATKLQEAIKQFPGYIVGVTVNNLEEEVFSSINKDYDFIAASTTKVIIATITYQQAEQGKINIDATLPGTGKSFRDNVYVMIVNSDNNSWKSLMDYFGYSNINKWTQDNGYNSFTTNGNIINSGDMAQFLKDLQNRELLTEKYSLELLNLMQQSWTGPLNLESQFQGLPKKTGWLEDRMHFVGVMPKQNVSFSIYTETTANRIYDYNEGTEMINSLLNVINANSI